MCGEELFSLNCSWNSKAIVLWKFFEIGNELLPHERLVTASSNFSILSNDRHETTFLHLERCFFFVFVSYEERERERVERKSNCSMEG